MKKILFFAGLLFLSTASCFAKPVHVEISFDIGRPKFNCQHGVWFCNTKSDISGDPRTIFGGMILEITDGEMVIQFNSDLDGKPAAFFAEKGEEISLPADLCKRLGYNKIIIIPSKYQIDYSSGKHGQVTVKIETE